MIEGIEPLTPKKRTKSIVERSNIAGKAILQPCFKLAAACRALATIRMLLPHFIIYLKAQHISVVPEAAAQLRTNSICEFPECWIVVAMIVPSAIAAPHTLIIHVQRLRILARHPNGLAVGVHQMVSIPFSPS